MPLYGLLRMQRTHVTDARRLPHGRGLGIDYGVAKIDNSQCDSGRTHTSGTRGVRVGRRKLCEEVGRNERCVQIHGGITSEGICV